MVGTCFFKGGVLVRIDAESPLKVQGAYGLSIGGELGTVNGELVWNPEDSLLPVDNDPGSTIDISQNGNEVDEPKVSSYEMITWLGVHVVPDKWPDYIRVEFTD